jgi:hypothetical protein
MKQVNVGSLLQASFCFLSLVTAASGNIVTITNYDSQNFNPNAGYVRGSGIISSSQPASLRWQGNDPYDTNTLLGETDLVARVTGYTPSPLANSSLIQGGLGVGDGILPGTTNVSIWKSFSPTTLIPDATVTFFAEWSLIPSLEGAPYNLSDTFAFDLRNAANTQSLLKFELTPGINIQPNSYTLQTIAAGVGTNTLIDLGYQGLFQIQASITGTTYDLSLAQINSTNRSVITNYNLVTGGSLAAGMSALDLATIAVDWQLASGNNLEPGSNYVVANQFQVTSTGTPIPEPGTWVASLLLLGLGFVYLRRRNALQASSLIG